MKRFFLLLSLLLTLHGFSQKHYFVNYDRKEGLPQSNVFTIFQDNRGYLWFGTEAGVCRYDGKEFVTFDEDNGLPSSKVKAICQDKYNNLWFGTEAGVCKYDGKTFITYSSEELPNVFKSKFINNIRTLFFDKDNMLWIGTDGGLISYDQDTTWNYYWNEFAEDSSKSFYNKKYVKNVNKYRSIIQDNDGVLWLGTLGGLVKYKNNTFHNYTKEDGLISLDVMGLTKDSDENLWIATLSGGVSVFDKINKWTSITSSDGLCSNEIVSIFSDDDGVVYIGTVGQGICVVHKDRTFENISTNEGLSNNRVLAILKDKQGVFWFGTEGGGLCKYNGKRFLIYTKESTKRTIINKDGKPKIVAGLSDNNIRSVFQDKDGAMWFGSFGGASRWDGKKYKNFKPEKNNPESISSPYVMDISQDKLGRMWFGTFVGSACMYDGEKFTKIGKEQGLKSNHVISIYQDRDSVMWFGTFNGVFRYDGNSFKNFTKKNTNNGLNHNRVVAIFQDRDGAMWFGTDGGGVSVYDGDTFKAYTTEDGLAYNVVRSICQDESGVMWFAADRGGVSLFDGVLFDTINKNSGIQSNRIWIMIPDNDGNVWIGHSEGVEKISIATKEIRSYGYREGFTPIEINAGAVFMDKRGRLWFGTPDGVVKYSPSDDKPNDAPPIITISEIKLFGINIEESEYYEKFDYMRNLPINLKLPHDQNRLAFKYIGIHSIRPDLVRYKYKLQGSDEAWSDETIKTEIEYRSLNPGSYSFMVKSCNNEGVWNDEPAKFSFIIKPPLWETTWFYGGESSIMIVLLLLAYFFQKRKPGSKVATNLILLNFLIVVESLIFLSEKYLSFYTGSIPIIIISLNILMALSFHPVHNRIDRWLKEGVNDNSI